MTIRKITTSVPYDSNIYLVSGDRPIVVDAGTGLDSASVARSIRSLTDVPPVAGVATHCHYDHIGGIRALVDEFGCRVLAGRLDAPYIRDSDPDVTVSRMFGGSLSPVEVEDLDEGDLIDTGDHSFRVLETPGHTPGGICLYEESTGWLISGDTLFLDGFGRTDFAGGSMSALRSSLLRLSKVDIRGLFPGHGNTSDRYSPELMQRALRLAGV